MIQGRKEEKTKKERKKKNLRKTKNLREIKVFLNPKPWHLFIGQFQGLMSNGWPAKGMGCKNNKSSNLLDQLLQEKGPKSLSAFIFVLLVFLIKLEILSKSYQRPRKLVCLAIPVIPR